MRMLVAVCIYNRFENLRKWTHAWKQCDTSNAELVIIQNADANVHVSPYQSHCRQNRIKHVVRDNIGFETGIIQDIFLRKLKIDHHWDALLFCTDDTIPMSRDFVNRFRAEVSKKDVGVACMEISGVWTPHIRTTGFCVTRDVANKVIWVHNPIETKRQCYFFEHQGFENTFMSQVLKMDKRVVQLSSVRECVLWDAHHHADHNRMDEWNREFPGFKE